MTSSKSRVLHTVRHAVMLAMIWLAAASSSAAQDNDLPKDIKRTVDSFTGDTIWETKYGRLDNPKGCSRSNLAIVWKFERGPAGRAEWLTFQYIDIQGPFHSSTWVGAVSAALNIDGRFLEAKLQPLSTKLGHGIFGDPGDKEERGAFLLPDSTLWAVANAQVAKIRFMGTERSCDGTVEQNMKTRLQVLLGAVEGDSTTHR